MKDSLNGSVMVMSRGDVSNKHVCVPGGPKRIFGMINDANTSQPAVKHSRVADAGTVRGDFSTSDGNAPSYDEMYDTHYTRVVQNLDEVYNPDCMTIDMNGNVSYSVQEFADDYATACATHDNVSFTVDMPYEFTSEDPFVNDVNKHYLGTLVDSSGDVTVDGDTVSIGFSDFDDFSVEHPDGDTRRRLMSIVEHLFTFPDEPVNRRAYNDAVRSTCDTTFSQLRDRHSEGLDGVTADDFYRGVTRLMDDEKIDPGDVYQSSRYPDSFWQDIKDSFRS